jgi:hypothetical protein
MQVSPEYMKKFDELFEQYMLDFAGSNWRTMCHQAAKIASRSLQLLFPSIKIKIKRVEVIAWMEGAKSFVHIGWLEDPNKIEGKMPAHFAVEVGKGLYDPTFYQLRFCKTPLDLPEDQYFYYPEFIKLNVDKNGFRWFYGDRPSGVLHIGYMFQDAPLSKEDLEQLMSDGLAKKHGEKVAALCRKIKI